MVPKKIRPGWYGTVQLLLTQRITIIIIVLLLCHNGQHSMKRKPRSIVQWDDRIHAQLQRVSSRKSAVLSITVVRLLATSVLPLTYDAFLAWSLFLQQNISSKTVANKQTTNPSLAIPAKRTNSNNTNIQYALLQMCYFASEIA